MLILSRRENQSILFPNLNIKVVISRVAGRIVQVGIDAPREVRILRGELADPSLPRSEMAESAKPNGVQVINRHAIRNRLNNAMLGLQVLQASVEAGQTDDLESLVFKVFQTLSEINDALGQGSETANGIGKTAHGEELARGEELGSGDALHALIVDDSQNEATLLAQFLQLKGFTPHIVRNGREAMRWLEENPRPQVVLMDMMMPEMDGPTAVREIRKDRRFDQVQLFGVSGLEPRDVGLRAGLGGVDHWFQKPVNAVEIAEQISRSGRRPVPV